MTVVVFVAGLVVKRLCQHSDGKRKQADCNGKVDFLKKMPVRKSELKEKKDCNQQVCYQ